MCVDCRFQCYRVDYFSSVIVWIIFGLKTSSKDLASGQCAGAISIFLLEIRRQSPAVTGRIYLEYRAAHCQLFGSFPGIAHGALSDQNREISLMAGDTRASTAASAPPSGP